MFYTSDIIFHITRNMHIYLYFYIYLISPWIEHCLPWINIRHLNINQENNRHSIDGSHATRCHLDVKGNVGRVPLAETSLSRKPHGLSIELRTSKEAGSIRRGCSRTRAGRGWVTAWPYRDTAVLFLWRFRVATMIHEARGFSSTLLATVSSPHPPPNYVFSFSLSLSLANESFKVPERCPIWNCTVRGRC